MNSKYMFLTLVAIAALAFTARADGTPVVEIAATNVVLGNSVLNMSFQFDPTLNRITPGTLSIVFSNSNLGSQFYVSSIGSGGFFDFRNAGGDFLQLDPANQFGTPQFPEIGSYPTWIVDTICSPRNLSALDTCNSTVGQQYTNGSNGSLTVTAIAAPEPQAFLMLLAGLFGFILLSPWRRFRSACAARQNAVRTIAAWEAFDDVRF